MSDMTSNNKTRSILTALACAVCMMCHSGYTSVFSMHVPYMMKALSVPASTVQLISIMGSAVGIVLSLFIAKPLIKKITPRFTLMCGSVAVILHGVLTSITTSIPLLIILGGFAGVIQALGAVMCASLVLSEYRSVWKNSLPKVIGICACCQSAGAALFKLLAGWTIATFGWQGSFQILGVGMGGLAIIINLLLIRKPVSDGTAVEGGAAVSLKKQPVGDDGLTYKEVLRTPSMYLLMIGIVMCAMMYTGTVKYLPTFLYTTGMDSMQYAPYASFQSLAAMAINFCTGFLLVKFGTKGFTGFVFVGGAIGLFCVTMYYNLTATWILLIGLVLMSCGVSANSLSSQYCPRLFGPKEFKAINPVVNTAYLVGNLASSYVLGRIAEAFGTYRAAHVCSIICGLIGFVCIMLAIRLTPYKAKAQETAAEAA